MRDLNSNAVLTFKDGRFFLQEGAHSRTVSLKEAAGCKAIADERAEKVLERALVKRYPLPALSLPPFLDDHQVAGIQWALTRSRSYLAHAPGAGKTCEAIIAALWSSGPGRIVFVVPPALTANWVAEIEKFYFKVAGASPVVLLTRVLTISVLPPKAKRDTMDWGAQFIIIPDSMLTRDWVLKGLLSMPIRFLAVDEASRFKEPTSERTRALFGGKLKGGDRSPGLIGRAKHTVLLDGSPMPNRPMELWAPTFATSPETIDFMTQEEFGFRYCGAKMNERGQWEFKHSSNETELSFKLQKEFMHVVTEDKLNHPERKRKIILINEEVRTREMRAFEKESLSDFRLEDLDESASQGDLATYRKELGLKKIQWVIDYVYDRLLSHKKEHIILFAWHREVCRRLAQGLLKFKPGLIMGGIDLKARMHMVEAFQAGRRRLIIGNIDAIGRGLNLQAADRVVFAEYSWNGETNRQCEKRASRKGRSEECPVRCDYIVAPNSIDEMILRAVMRKDATVKKVIG